MELNTQTLLGEHASLPNIDSHEVGNPTQVGFTTIRLFTSQTLEQVYTYFEPWATHLLVSKEGGDAKTRLHYHIIMNTEFYGRDKVCKQFRESLIKAFSIKGNGSYSIAPVKEKDKCVSYILKDGEWLAKGFSTTYLQSRQKVSYQKYSKEEFAKQFEALKDKYYLHQVSIRQFIRLYVKLKHSFNQMNVSLNRTQDLVLNMEMRAHPAKLDEFVLRVMHFQREDYDG